jgi:GDP-D-mannose 3', 5'-epimerase
MRIDEYKKSALVLGGGGFIGGHLAKRLKQEGFWVRIVDIKEKHEFWNTNDICNEYICADLTDPRKMSLAMFGPKQHQAKANSQDSFDEVYQLAADMGGAGYIFTGENDANVMHSSALINLNAAHYASQFGVKRIFYSSSACIYPAHNQLDPNNPNCAEDSAYPADPDSEYGWEKLFSERLYAAYARNHDLDVRVARFHNIFGPQGTWKGGKEKAPAAMCRKVAEDDDGEEIEVWGPGTQTRSFLYIDNCVEAVLRFMRQDNHIGPINIGSEEMVSINQLAELVIDISGKPLTIKNIKGPLGVNGRNSDNNLFRSVIGYDPSKHKGIDLRKGMEKTYNWIKKQIHE